MRALLRLSIFFIFTLFILSYAQVAKPTVKLNLNSAPDTVSLFAEGLISTALSERDMTINTEGTELIYTLGDYKESKRVLVSLKKVNGTWNEPTVLPFSGQFQDIEAFFSPDGKRLYFCSNRPIYNDPSRSDYNIWYSEKNGEDWAEPVALDSVINTKGNEFYPSIGNSGTLYFTATKKDGIGREDIYKSQLKNGKYQKPTVLGEAINSPFFEFNAYVNPSENLIIFSSFGRKDGLGGGDLYISTKDEKGKWKPAKNMGAEINSSKLDYCPFIDWNNSSFYFSSTRHTNVSKRIKTIAELKKSAARTTNGFSNIYWINLNQLNLTLDGN